MDEVNLIMGDGSIARALEETAIARGKPFLRTTRRRDRVGDRTVYLDLADQPESWPLPERCSAAFLCAAVTAPAVRRSDPAASRLINVTRTLELARRLEARGAFVVFPSSNLVFDGSTPFTPSDLPTSPGTEYGRQKVEAERGLLDLGENGAILRMSKIVDRHTGLLRDWIVKLRGGSRIRAFSDMVFSPIPAPVIADLMLRISTARLGGLSQISAGLDISYLEFARLLARRVGADEGLVESVKSPTGAGDQGQRPRNTTLDASRLVSALGIDVPAVGSAADWLVSVC